MTSEARGPLRWWGAGMDVLVGVVIIVLLWGLLIAYVFGGSFLGATPEKNVAGIWATAVAIVVLLIFVNILAYVQERRPTAMVHPIVSLIVGVIAVMLAIGPIDWSPDTVYPANPGACTRTDSENCPGG